MWWERASEVTKIRGGVHVSHGEGRWRRSWKVEKQVLSLQVEELFATFITIINKSYRGTFSCPLCISAATAICHPSSLFQEEKHPPFFPPRCFVSVLCCLWRLNGASLTGPSTVSRRRAAAATVAPASCLTPWRFKVFK